MNASKVLKRALFAAMVSSFIVQGSFAADAQKDTRGWNNSDVLNIGGLNALTRKPTKFDNLESVRQFELMQLAVEKLKLMVLQDALTEQEAGEGVRMIMKILAMTTYDVLYPNFRYPLFKKLDTRFRDGGAFNPDAEYDHVWIDARYDYKLTGTLGTVPYVSLSFNRSDSGETNANVAYLGNQEIRKHADKDGNYVVWLTKEKPKEPGIWVKLPDDASGITTRQYVGDRKKETLATFELHAIGDKLPPTSRFSDDEIAARIARTVRRLIINSTWERTLVPYIKEKPNTFFEKTANDFGGDVANSANLYDFAYYKVEDDEALVIDFKPPNTVYWNLTCTSIWHESENYLTDPISITSSRAVKRRDGTVRIFVSNRDPHLNNWVKTAYNRGFLYFRLPEVSKNPLPTITRIKFADIAKYK